jgi:hypothetical protein
VKLARAVSVVIVTIAASFAFGQTVGTKNSSADADMHGLIIYGENFAFLASEPDNWDTDTGQVAREYSVNAIFFPRAQASRTLHVTIRVRLNRKTTEDPNADMNSDMTQYKKEYPSTRFADLNLKHPDYRISTKLFYTEKEFYEYVAYLNPGPQFKFIFSVVLSKERVPAANDELDAFAHVLQSLRFVTEDVKIKNTQ